MPAKLTATALKSLIKSLPGKVLLECNPDGNIDLHIEEQGHVYIGSIDFKTGKLLLVSCPTCGLGLEETGTKGKIHCPSCKNVFQE
jgi:hypothetical protein